MPGSLTGRFGADHPQWKGDHVTYDGAHARVYRLRGSASQYVCVQCGNKARDWAYDRSDPNELNSPEGWPYSGDPDHYLPMCVSCHRRLDPTGLRGQHKTHCKRGHAFNEANVYVTPDGRRNCRTCRREAGRRRHRGGR